MYIFLVRSDAFLHPLKMEQFQQGIEETNKIVQSWDTIWEKVLDPTLAQGGQIAPYYLYKSICNLGLTFAVGTLVFLAVYHLKLLLDGNLQEYFSGLFLPIVLSFLLVNNGKNLAHYSFEIRDIINKLNQEILASAVNGLNMQESFQKIQQYTALNYATPTLIQQCEKLSGEDQYACLKEEMTKLKAFSDRNLPEWSTTTGTQNPPIGYQPDEGDPDVGDWAKEQLFDITYPWKVMGTEFTEVASFIHLRAQQNAYQQLLEGSMLLTALAGPLAVGGMLLFGGQSLFTWLTGFFTIGLAKICFNLIAGLAAVSELIAGPGDPLPLTVLIANYAPILSVGLAALGGMTVWQGITSAFSQTVETGVKLAQFL